MIKKIAILAVCLLTLAFFSASAQTLLPNPLRFQTFWDIISSIADFIRWISGGLAVIMFLWAGILFLTSAGNETRLASAKKTLLFAVIGLAIAVSGSVLVELTKWILGG